MRATIPILLFALFSFAAQAQKADPGKSKGESDPALKALGALSAAQMYSQYVLIGVTADAYANKVYEPKQVQEMINEARGIMANVSKNLTAVGKDGSIVQNDRVFIMRIQSVFQLLDKQANALVAFTQDDNSDNRAAFEAARKSSWDAISGVLGIGKKGTTKK